MGVECKCFPRGVPPHTGPEKTCVRSQYGKTGIPRGLLGSFTQRAEEANSDAVGSGTAAGEEVVGSFT